MARDLSRMLRPRSIAVFGGGWAENVVAQCRKIGFKGDVWPVHPSRKQIGGLPCFRSVQELPGAPDLAFIGVNRHATLDVLKALSERGCGGATCFASGFAEAGGQDLQQQLIAAAGDMPLLGPNCYGILNYFDGMALWPDQHGGRILGPDAKGVALISQSSNIVINMTMNQRGLPIGYVACVGNGAVMDSAAIADSLLQDDRVTAIGFYIEGIADAYAFMGMAMHARAKDVPLVALTTGKTAKSRDAAASHTAALTGGAAATSAFLRRCGIAEVDDLSTWAETLKLLHVTGPLEDNRICTISSSGGEAGLIADLADRLDLELPDQKPEKAAELSELLGPLVPIANPFDYHTFIWGDEDRTAAVFETMLAAGPGHKGYDLALFILDYPHEDRCDSSDWTPTTNAIRRAQQATGVPVGVVASLSENISEARADALMADGLVPLNGLAEALKAAGAGAKAGLAVDPAWRPLPPASDATVDLIDEASAKAFLLQAGLPVPAGVRSISDTAALEGPFAVKALGLAHKSEAGAVKLNVPHDGLETAIAALPPAPGILIEQMVTSGVAELLIGLQRDPVFDATLTVGMGGVTAELLQDTATLILPASNEEIMQALLSLRLAPLLSGYRGRPAAAIDVAAETIARLADLFIAQPGLSEIEINPLILTPERVWIADALMKGQTDV